MSLGKLITNPRKSLKAGAAILSATTLASPAFAATTTGLPMEQLLLEAQDLMQGNYARAGSIILMVVSGLGVANSEGNSPAIKTLSKLGLGVGIALNAAAWTNMLGTAAAITF